MDLFKPNLILAGFMGTGKTTVGQIVAAALGMPFVDTDAEIEALARQEIPSIFAQQGEPVFRKLESIVCLKAAIGGGQVIATGGGALLNAATREALAGSGLLVCLTADLDAIVERVEGDASRPLARDREALEQVLAQRAELYASLPYRIDTTGKTPESVAGEVIVLWRQHV